MPFPIAPMIIIASAPAATAANAAMTYTLTALGTVAAVTHAFYSSSAKDNLPTFTDTSKVMTDPVHAKAEALVSASTELLAQEGQQSHEERARMDAVLTSAEGHTRSLGERILAIPSEPASSHEAVQAVTADFQQQKLDIKVMKETLGNLPELLKARRDQQALLVENQQLKSENKVLEGKILELTSCLDEALSLAEESQAENDVLRNQAQPADENRQNANTNFSVSIFRS
jgi:hypothetical protein